MRSTLGQVAALLVGVSLLLTGQGLQGTLLPVRASLEHFGAIPIGIIGGAYFLGFTLGCLKGGEFVARVGHIRVFAAMTGLASASPLLHGLFVDPWVWTVLRALTGFCFAVLYVVIESWLNEASTNENRGTVFSVYVMISMTVLGAGQLMLLLYDPQQLYLFALVSVLVSIAALPVVMSTGPAPRRPRHVALNLRRLYAISPAGVVACLCCGLANGAFWSLAPAFTVSVSEQYSLAALFMAANVAGGAASQWPIGWLSDRLGRRPPLIGCAIACAVIATFTAAFSATLPQLAIIGLGFAWGATAFPQYAIAVANANDHAKANEYVMVSSGLLLMYGIGAIAGPLVASTAMAWLGDPALYTYTAIVHLFAAGYITFRTTQRPAPAEAEHLDFSESIVAAATASPVYEETTAGQPER